jgi:hypothetical protein
LPAIARHIAKFTDCGIILVKFNKLPAFKTVVAEEFEINEESLPSPDPAPIPYECSWGSILRNYNRQTSNPYLNWPFPQNVEDAQGSAGQVKYFFYSYEGQLVEMFHFFLNS